MSGIQTVHHFRAAARHLLGNLCPNNPESHILTDGRSGTWSILGLSEDNPVSSNQVPWPYSAIYACTVFPTNQMRDTILGRSRNQRNGCNSNLSDTYAIPAFPQFWCRALHDASILSQNGASDGGHCLLQPLGYVGPSQRNKVLLIPFLRWQ